MAKKSKSGEARPSWADIRKRVDTFDRKSLVGLVRDLYHASSANRRFLDARLLPSSNSVEQYRRLVADAVYPDPFSRRRVSLSDASTAIIEYRRSTGDLSGTVDLMLTFLEAGTEQAADLGYGDESYFVALERKLDAIAKTWTDLSAEARAEATKRLEWIQKRAKAIGWGYGDYVDDIVSALPTLAGSKKAS
jgi:hypothetical protein